MAESTLRKGNSPHGPDLITWAPKSRELSTNSSRKGFQRDSKHEKDSAPHSACEMEGATWEGMQGNL